ncbi:MAG TPA: EamA family transporter [Candidatus Limnocylindria bacterium]|nr:EamA family transporter [Candidatus Limnocylindria bacterium]
MILIGGSNFVAVRFSNAELAPFWGAAIRFLPASLLLFGAMAVWRVPMPYGSALVGALLWGGINFGIGYALAYFGLQQVNAGTASVLLATVPLFTLGLAVLQRLEHLRPRPALGALIALAGIAVVFGEQLSANVAPIYPIAILLNAVAAAEAGVIAKRFPRTHPFATNAVGMLVGGAFLLALSFATGETHALPQRADTQLAVAYLATVGAIGLFGLFIFVVNRWTVSATSYALVVMPLVAISLGALLRGEGVSPFFLVGAAVVAVGVYVGALSGGGREPEARERRLPA